MHSFYIKIIEKTHKNSTKNTTRKNITQKIQHEKYNTEIPHALTTEKEHTT